MLMRDCNNNTTFSTLHKNEFKQAIGTSLEVSIMGSALILTLSLQIQEVVGSRNGYHLDQVSLAYSIFMIAVSLSFSLSFYSIVTAAVLLIPMSSIASRHSMTLVKNLRWCFHLSRICTLLAAVSLAVAVLTSSFVGIHDFAAIISALLIGIGLLITILTTITILIYFRRMKRMISIEEEDESKETCTSDSLTKSANQSENEKQVSPSSKIEGMRDQPHLPALSSLTTTAFNFRSIDRSVQ